MGIFFGGIALGPTLGGWVVGRTGSILSAFWIATAVHILYAFFVTFFLPESTSPQRREAAQAEHVAQAARRAELAGQARDSEHMAQSKASKLATLAKASPAFAFLRPLAMLLPRKIEQTTQADSQDESAEPLLTSRAGAAPEAGISHISVSHISSKRRRDWNLTLLSLSYFVELASMGILSSKVQYAQ